MTNSLFSKYLLIFLWFICIYTCERWFSLEIILGSMTSNGNLTANPKLVGPNWLRHRWTYTIWSSTIFSHPSLNLQFQNRNASRKLREPITMMKSYWRNGYKREWWRTDLNCSPCNDILWLPRCWSVYVLTRLTLRRDRATLPRPAGSLESDFARGRASYEFYSNWEYRAEIFNLGSVETWETERLIYIFI